MSTDINTANLDNNNGRAARVTPWTQVVRGESEATVSVPVSPSSVSQLTVPSLAMTLQSKLVVESSSTQAEGEESGEGGGGGSASGNAGKKPVWNKPSANGVAVASVEPMMGTHAWPALSETTRGSSTKPSPDSLKGLSDGSSSVSQVTATANLTSQKQVNNNGNPNSAPNHTAPTRQRSLKRNGGNASNSGLSQSPAPQRPVVEGPLNNPSHREHTQKVGFATHSHGGNDHPQQRGSFRRNGNSHPRGDGTHNHNYGGRRDHDRGNQDWNAHRHFNGREGHMQPQRVAQRFMRNPPPPPPPPQPSSSQFIPPPTVQPFGSPIRFPELASPVYYVAAPPPETYRGVPFAPIPPHALFFSAPDPQLQSRIVYQIDYYFSNENLIKDTYLRQNMDEQGWVPIKLIAGFKKVSLLTDNIQLILDSVRSSTVVEVQGDKIRKRNDWARWIMPPGQFSNASSPGKSSHDTFEQKTDQLNAQGVSDSSVSARNTN